MKYSKTKSIQRQNVQNIPFIFLRQQTIETYPPIIIAIGHPRFIDELSKPQGIFHCQLPAWITRGQISLLYVIVMINPVVLMSVDYCWSYCCHWCNWWLRFLLSFESRAPSRGSTCPQAYPRQDHGPPADSLEAARGSWTLAPFFGLWLVGGSNNHDKCQQNHRISQW